jgi:ornithine cyclodeaminase/alanine dehydrogenase-like protein (mu-crystallin family)
MLIMTVADTVRALSYDPRLQDIVRQLEAGFVDYYEGRLVVPPGERIRLYYPPDVHRSRWTHDMRNLPAIIPSLGIAGVRVGASGNAHRWDENQPSPGSFGDQEQTPGACSYLFDFDIMKPAAVIMDHQMHGVRAGAPSGIGAKYLAKKDSRTACCIGSGRIMRSSITSIITNVPTIERVKVFSPDEANRRAFAEVMSDRLDMPFEPVDSAEEAVRGSDVVAIVTNSHFAPVIDGNWLEPGQTVTSITPGEIDETTILRSQLFVTTRDRTLHDNPPRQPLAGMIERGVVGPEYIVAELGELITGRHPGRTSEDEIITFLSPGVGFYDMVVATWVYRVAREHGIGTDVELH